MPSLLLPLQPQPLAQAVPAGAVVAMVTWAAMLWHSWQPQVHLTHGPAAPPARHLTAQVLVQERAQVQAQGWAMARLPLVHLCAHRFRLRAALSLLWRMPTPATQTHCAASCCAWPVPPVI